MLKLAVFNTVLMIIAVIGVVLCRKYVKSDRGKRTVLIIVSLLTVACHYSSLLYHFITEGTGWGHLVSNPNLLLPIYPCNVVMWCAVILAFVDFRSRTFEFLSDYLFLFGIVSTLVGMFANVDFIRNPTLRDYDVTTGILAHATLFFNVILLPAFGLFRLDFKKNILHILMSIIGMFLIGCYCNLLIRVLGSEEYAYNVNSMFILHSPFEGMPYLTYPLIGAVALVAYTVVLFVCDRVFRRKREVKGNTK